MEEGYAGFIYYRKGKAPRGEEEVCDKEKAPVDGQAEVRNVPSFTSLHFFISQLSCLPFSFNILYLLSPPLFLSPFPFPSSSPQNIQLASVSNSAADDELVRLADEVTESE